MRSPGSGSSTARAPGSTTGPTRRRSSTGSGSLAAAGEDLPLDDGGRATIGVVHVDDAARILLDAPPGPANVAAETVTVADVARLARGEPRRDEPGFTVASPFTYRHALDDYLRP